MCNQKLTGKEETNNQRNMLHLHIGVSCKTKENKISGLNIQ